MQIRPAAKTRNRQTTFYVDSDSGVTYIVHNKRHSVSHRKVWTCNCPDFTERRQFTGTQCKHIDAVQAKIRLDTPVDQDPQRPLPSVRGVLDMVVSVLNGPVRSRAGQLWDVLTALRGPDSDDYKLKDLTTATIRHAIGLKSDSQPGIRVVEKVPFGAKRVIDAPGQLPDSVVSDLINQHKAQYHFAVHYRSALLALC